MSESSRAMSKKGQNAWAVLLNLHYIWCCDAGAQDPFNLRAQLQMLQTSHWHWSCAMGSPSASLESERSGVE